MQPNRALPSDSSVGIDLQRITNPGLVIEELKCLVCAQIVWNPVSCSQCESLYCDKCHQEWIEKNRDTGAQCSKGCDSKITPVGKVASKLLSRLLVSCSNKNHGCSIIISYDNLEQHEKVCPYQQSICQGCQKMILTIELLQHTDICGEVAVTCPICEKVLTRDELQKSHDKLDCVVYKTEKMEEKHKEEVLFLQDQIKNMAKNMEKVEERHQEEMNSFQSQIKTLEKDYDERLKKTEERHQVEMNFFQNSYHEKLKILEEQFANKLEILVDKYGLKMKLDKEANSRGKHEIKASWCWDANHKSVKIQLSENNTKAVKIDHEKCFSAVLGNKKFQPGHIHLWEISVSTQDISKACQWIQIGIIEVSSDVIINIENFPYNQAFGFSASGYTQQPTLTSYGDSLRNSTDKLDNKTYRLELNTKIGSFKVLHEGNEVCSASNSKFKEKEFLPFVVLHQKSNTATLKIID